MSFNRAISCSSDQSLKIWDPDSRMHSVHANEPFTSFVVCGASSNDYSSHVLVASLSYSIRLYKMRTFSLTHSILLKDLKQK